MGISGLPHNPNDFQWGQFLSRSRQNAGGDGGFVPEVGGSV